MQIFNKGPNAHGSAGPQKALVYNNFYFIPT